jgi:hypothetical protein
MRTTGSMRPKHAVFVPYRSEPTGGAVDVVLLQPEVPAPVSSRQAETFNGYARSAARGA